MAALNFPTENLVAGVTQYTSDLGTTYIWDGVKWVGHSAGGAVGTNSIANNGHTVQVNADGDLVLPAYSFPNTAGTEAQVLTWPAEGTVLEWTTNSILPADAAGYLVNDGSGNLSWAAGDGTGLSITDFGRGFTNALDNGKITTNKLYNRPADLQLNNHFELSVDDGGVVHLPDQSIINGATLKSVPGNYAGITAGPEGADEDSWMWVDPTGAFIATKYNTSQHLWSFDNTGVLTLPEGGDIRNSTGSTVLGGASIGDLNIYGNTIESQSGNTFVNFGGDFDDLVIGTNQNQGLRISLNENNNEVGWQFSTDGNLTLPGGGIVGDTFGDGGLTIQSPQNEYVEFGSYDGNAYLWIADTDYYGGKSSGVYISTDYNGDDHRWEFDATGNLILPVGGDILSSSGQSVLGGGAGNGSSISNNGETLSIRSDGEVVLSGPEGGVNRGIRWDYGSNNGGVDSFIRQDEAGFTVQSYADEAYPDGNDIILRTGDSSNIWRFRPDGNLQLPQGSAIKDQATSIDITIDRISESTYWYNLFGDTGATITANTAVNGSVCHDTGGNVYVLGSSIRGGSLDSDNLFLKYSPEGNLLWRRTWTDNSGEDCGSYNASMRFVAANVELGTQDTIVWAAQIPWNYISYVGTMDTEGNLVDQYGDVRLPTRLDNFVVTDIEWSGNVPMVGDSMVTVVGQHYYSGPGYHFPAVAGVDLDGFAVIGDTTVMPDGTDLNVGLLSGTPWANMYKAIAVIPNSTAAATVGSYYDGSYSHAMVSISDNSPPVTYGIGADNFSTNQVAGEDICCDNYGNVYVLCNNISSGYAVLVKSMPNDLAEGLYAWQLLLGPNGLSSDEFYASSVVYDNGFVYVLGQYYDADTDQSDTMLIKIGIANGNIIWSRRIGTPGNDGLLAYGPPGWSSSSGISVYDDAVVISFATEDKIPGLGGQESNTVTLQYPMSGDLLGTFGDFEISDFDPGHEFVDYNITTLNTSLGGDSITAAAATLNATTLTVGTGWTNTQWDMLQNRQVFDPQTWKFNYDGTFDTPEIRHQNNVKITANTVSGTDTATWTFQNNKGLRFPDGSVQYGAYVETEIALDGGSAVTVFNIPLIATVADGGGSGSRFGINDPVYDGSSGNNYVLDGGGA